MIAHISQFNKIHTNVSIEHLVNAFEYVNASKTAENGTYVLRTHVFVVLDLLVLTTPEFAWCQFLTS